MAQASFSVNIPGRVKNTPLPLTRSLVPLFEAVMNSFEAIEEQRHSNQSEPYWIKITVKYDGQRSLFDEDSRIARNPDSFIIEDNGAGFNQQNLESFLTSDSGYKELTGGKGIGRFFWLKAFDSVNVDSQYQTEGGFRRRQFVFTMDREPLRNLVDSVSDGPRTTKVTLSKMHEKYSKSVPKGLETVAMRIVEHFLVLFIRDDCPTVTLVDDESVVVLNDLFQDRINVDSNRSVFKMGESEFRLLHIKLNDSAVRSHRIMLCANSRVVKEENLDKLIVDLSHKIEDDQGGFWYTGIVESEFLDRYVDSDRMEFDIPEMSAESPLTKDGIMAGVSEQVEKYVSTYLSKIREQKMLQIAEFAKNTSPQYRHLLKNKEEELKKIKPGLSDDKLDEQLNRINRDFDREIREQGIEVARNFRDSSIMDSDAYKELFANLFRKINDYNKSTLAEYVAHRRIILDMMDAALRSIKEGKYEKEKFLHDIIFPLGKTSDEIVYDQHNLWLIDEKLAFHFFLSSDKPIKVSLTHQRGEPDIMVLDNPIATTDTEENSFHDSIVIFELKRPMRDDYTNDDNPIDQLIDYARKLRHGSVDCNGRPIRVSENTRYYLYAICDVTPTLSTILEKFNFKKTPDGQGYFMVNEALNAVIEVLSFDKLLLDSKRRNKILFDKLGCN